MEEVIIHFTPMDTIEDRDEKLYDVYIKHMPIKIKQFTFYQGGNVWVDDLTKKPVNDAVYRNAEQVAFKFVYLP